MGRSATRSRPPAGSDHREGRQAHYDPHRRRRPGIICANSSPAKGRVERANKTLQDRLVKELRLAGAATLAEGNALLTAPAQIWACGHRRLRAEERTRSREGSTAHGRHILSGRCAVARDGRGTRSRASKVQRPSAREKSSDDLRYFTSARQPAAGAHDRRHGRLDRVLGPRRPAV